jgi:hypothetical protein
MIARIAPIPRSSKAILRSLLQGHKGGDWLISGLYVGVGGLYRC